MSEPSQNPDESPIASAKRGIRWDAMAAIIASLVGLLALVVAGYTAYIQRQQVRAQVWPYLIGVHSGGRSELVWVNKGVGPAIVRSVVVTADGKILRNWKDVFRVLGIPGAVYDQSFLNGNVLSAGETLPWIHFSKTADYDAFLSNWTHKTIDAVACYCSTLNECWTTRFGQTERNPVRECPALPASEQFTE